MKTTLFVHYKYHCNIKSNKQIAYIIDTKIKAIIQCFIIFNLDGNENTM